MERKVIAAIVSAALCAALSCEKESGFSDDAYSPLTISAVAEGIGIPAKAEMAYKYDVLWNTGDKIYVTDGMGGDTFSLVDGAGTAKGTFRQDGHTVLSGTAECIYPAVVGQSRIWPSVQTNGQVMPMYCRKTLSGNDAEEFGLSSLGAVIQIVFTTSQNTVLQSIEISDGSKTMSGAFSINANGQADIIATDHAGIVLDLGEGVAVGMRAKPFNIAVPAGTYGDLTLTFTASDGRICEMNSSSMPEIIRNTVCKVTVTGEFAAVQERDYVEITAKYDGTNYSSLKWAKENLAITDSGKKEWKGNGTGTGHVVGDYFQWAAYAGYCGKASDSDKGLIIYESFTNSMCGDRYDNIYFKISPSGLYYQFYIVTDSHGVGIGPYYNGIGYTKYLTPSTLASSDDVASICLGADWRTPTYSEIRALMEATYWKWDNTDKGFYVYSPNPVADAGKRNEEGSGTAYNKNKALLFFPASGAMSDYRFINMGYSGSYWSSTLSEDYIQNAYLAILDKSVCGQYPRARFGGFSVRPVSD